MISRWYESKGKALSLRKNGISIGEIERRLGVPRSTLSGWLRNVELSQKQKEKLTQNWKDALTRARKKAILWHNDQKKNRLLEAKNQALKTLAAIDATDKNILELALAILYMGEGTKRKTETSMGNSNPLILRFFLAAMKALYGINPKEIKCQLSLRADQNPEKMKIFWSKELDIPINNFGYVNLDQRTAGSKTYPDYKGVCYVICGGVAIQRKLICLSEMFCMKAAK
jgi:hypothetical protein